MCISSHPNNCVLFISEWRHHIEGVNIPSTYFRTHLEDREVLDSAYRTRQWSLVDILPGSPLSPFLLSCNIPYVVVRTWASVSHGTSYFHDPSSLTFSMVVVNLRLRVPTTEKDCGMKGLGHHRRVANKLTHFWGHDSLMSWVSVQGVWRVKGAGVEETRTGWGLYNVAPEYFKWTLISSALIGSDE